MNIIQKCKLNIAKHRITGRYKDGSPRRRLFGRQYNFCIRKHRWKTMWPFMVARETVVCRDMNNGNCENKNCNCYARLQRYNQLLKQTQKVKGA